MRDQIRIERLIRLERFIDKVQSHEVLPHLVDRWTKHLIDLFLAYVRAENPDWPDSNVSYKDIFNTEKNGFYLSYIHSPVQNRANEALKKIHEGDIQGAKEIIEKQLASDEAGKKIGSEIQAHNRSHRNKKGAYERLQEEIVKAKPDIGHKEFENALRKQVGRGVIVSMDDSLNEITLSDERVFTISGLKHRLSKIRKLI
jgi:hypothetical protein